MLGQHVHKSVVATANHTEVLSGTLWTTVFDKPPLSALQEAPLNQLGSHTQLLAQAQRKIDQSILPPDRSGLIIVVRKRQSVRIELRAEVSWLLVRAREGAAYSAGVSPVKDLSNVQRECGEVRHRKPLEALLELARELAGNPR
ncbi:hypothetical protein RRG08_031538 [Elysia crispata]|uniref:Uncharacterized protein n=1 Tax=Elysia crispata TaxID=231223 RepID=A0AAE0Z4Q6_9GAST|nr:hypothetical protein RRG08_031538 [Elysia crispata]